MSTIYGVKSNKSFIAVAEGIETYIVDSDEKLQDWANNSPVNNYAVVLIKNGTWHSGRGVNLTATGTRSIIGEPGSKVIFSDVEAGFYYEELPTDVYNFIQGVDCEIVIESEGDHIPFKMCLNLDDCKAYVSGEGSCRGFLGCKNLTNCYGFGGGVSGGSGFYDCDNLINCVGESYYEGATTNQCGFMSCFNLEFCEGTGMQRGFSNCNVLTACYGVGTSGYGFYSCTGMSRCRKLADSATATFDTTTCCANISSYNAEYAVANTPAGGFNLV